MNGRKIELSAVLQTAVEALRPMADSRGVRLTVALEPASCACDPGALQRLMHRLVARAIEITSGGGEVHVSLACIDEGAHVSVTDTGSTPLPPEELAAAQRVVEHCGGAVEAYSDAGGLGATLGVLLPLSR